MKTIITTILRSSACLLLTLFLMQCTRVIEEPIATESDEGDPFDARLMEHIGTLPTINHDLDELILPNGEIVSEFLKDNDPDFLLDNKRTGRINAETGPQLRKNLFLAKTTAIAYKLCNRETVYPKGSQPNEPEQHGLGYSYGQRNYLQRLPPPVNNCCQMYKIHGLDCSGLMYNILKESGYDPAETITAERIRQVRFWEQLFSDDVDLSKVTIKDLGPEKNLQEGDIIYWYEKKNSTKASHIGIVLKTRGGKLGIFQSNGGPPCQECETKFGPDRGCRQIPLTGVNWFGEKWGALRLVTDITGKWQMQLKCDWAEDNDVAVVFDIEFIGKEGANQLISISGTGEGIDYDGSYLKVEFKGEYNPALNLLKGRFYVYDEYSSDPRIDDIVVRLDKDDTGFVALTNIVKDDGACPGELKMINLSGPGNGRNNAAKVKLTRQNLFSSKK
jgi:hypothetical protein